MVVVALRNEIRKNKLRDKLKRRMLRATYVLSVEISKIHKLLKKIVLIRNIFMRASNLSGRYTP
ncbi:hypothetical protein N784_04305 [Pontibacillus litoralis JSM 072002]|uniref:Uncharacterized protein n=1 Tax=Pontibacillus litoralis JSM 072002 TaxID=1385512 RepID=A0A0A5G6C3_9BACI|nr:hypothetical protein N784_04305 [Pontibacillus litoralis JSM 072002]